MFQHLAVVPLTSILGTYICIACSGGWLCTWVGTSAGVYLGTYVNLRDGNGARAGQGGNNRYT